MVSTFSPANTVHSLNCKYHWYNRLIFMCKKQKWCQIEISTATKNINMACSGVKLLWNMKPNIINSKNNWLLKTPIILEDIYWQENGAPVIASVSIYVVYLVWWFVEMEWSIVCSAVSGPADCWSLWLLMASYWTFVPWNSEHKTWLPE